MHATRRRFWVRRHRGRAGISVWKEDAWWRFLCSFLCFLFLTLLAYVIRLRAANILVLIFVFFVRVYTEPCGHKGESPDPAHVCVFVCVPCRNSWIRRTRGNPLIRYKRNMRSVGGVSLGAFLSAIIIVVDRNRLHSCDCASIRRRYRPGLSHVSLALVMRSVEVESIPWR